MKFQRDTVDSFITHLLYNNVPTDNLITLRKDKINVNTIWVQKTGQILILPLYSNITPLILWVYLLLYWCEIPFLILNLNKEIYSTVRGKWGHSGGEEKRTLSACSSQNNPSCSFHIKEGLARSQRSKSTSEGKVNICVLIKSFCY